MTSSSPSGAHQLKTLKLLQDKKYDPKRERWPGPKLRYGGCRVMALVDPGGWELQGHQITRRARCALLIEQNVPLFREFPLSSVDNLLHLRNTGLASPTFDDPALFLQFYEYTRS